MIRTVHGECKWDIFMALHQKLTTGMSGCKDVNETRQIIPIGICQFSIWIPIDTMIIQKIPLRRLILLS